MWTLDIFVHLIDLCMKEDACLRPKRSMHKLLDYEIADYDFQKDFYSQTALLKQLVYAAFFL